MNPGLEKKLFHIFAKKFIFSSEGFNMKD